MGTVMVGNLRSAAFLGGPGNPHLLWALRRMLNY